MATRVHPVVGSRSRPVWAVLALAMASVLLWLQTAGSAAPDDAPHSSDPEGPLVVDVGHVAAL